jgi:predicted DNA-binding protein YlxM (UPF0122 family)
MAYSDDQWAKVRAYFERGLTLSEIVDRDDIQIKSRGSISKRATAEGWIAGEKKQTVSKEVQVKQDLSEILAQKETLPPVERNIHDALVSEQLQAVKFFRGANMLVANTVAIKVKEEGKRASFKELASAAQALGRTQESVLGKAPETVINNTNAVQTVIQHTPEQLRKLNQDLEDAC